MVNLGQISRNFSVQRDGLYKLLQNDFIPRCVYMSVCEMVSEAFMIFSKCSFKSIYTTLTFSGLAQGDQ